MFKFHRRRIYARTGQRETIRQTPKVTFECPTTEEGVRIRLEWPSRVKSKKLAILNEGLDQVHRAQVTYKTMTNPF